jgi:A118 family predicted phage portal protein
MESIDGGKNKKMFDNSEGRFFSIKQDLSMKGTETKQLFDKAVPEIRAQQFRQVITDSLNWACMTSGLGKNTLDVMPQHTATEVVHTEAEKMQNKSLHEQYLEVEIIKLVKSMCELSTMAGTDIDASEVTITWEDSVIVDTAEQKKLAMLELDAGIITKEEYRMKFMGETLKDAKAKIKAMGKEDSWRGNDEGRYKVRQAIEDDAEGEQE